MSTLSTEDRFALRASLASEVLGDKVWNILNRVDELVTVTLTAAAEAGNAIEVTINLVNLAGEAVSRAQHLHCHLYDSAMLDALAAAYTMAETGAGAAVSTSAKPGLLIDTDANGDAKVTITDVSGSSTATLYLKVDPLPLTGTNKPGVPALIAITFA